MTDILLVEDMSSEVELFMLALRRNKSAATVEVARDGARAVDLLLGAEGQPRTAENSLPRLVLLDINMPRMNGFEVLERLRADPRTRQLPVVMFSASDQKSDHLEAERLGADGYICKPSGFEKLCALLAELEKDWLG